MARLLKQSTAFTFRIGPFVDSTDGVTPETGLTIAQADIQISKNGGAFAQTSATTPTTTHDADGWYQCPLTATDTNTLGMLTVQIAMAGAAPVWEHFQVAPANIYDSVVSGTDVVDVNVTQWNGVALGTTNPLPNAAAGAAGGLPTDSTGKTSFNDLDAAGVRTAVGLSSANLDTQLSTIDSNVDAVLVDTGTTLETHLTDIKGATFSGATDSLEAIRDRGDAAWTTGAGGTPPQLLQNTTIATLASQTSFTLTAGSADNDAYNGAVAIITDSATSTQKAVAQISDYVGATKTVTLAADPAIFTMAAGDTIDILAAISNAPTAAQVRVEIDSNSTQLAAIVADTNELQTDLANGGRVDLLIDGIKAVTDAIPDSGAMTSIATAAALATVDSNVDAILVDTGTTIPALITALNDPTAATVAAAVWNALQSSHTTAGTFGELATEIASILADTNELQTDDVPGLIAALNDPTAAAVADAVWDEAQAGHVTAGTFGELATEIAAILVDTDTTIPALIAALNDLSAAEVNAEVVDALATDTYAEPGQGAPAATATIAAKINYLYKAWRNKTEQTATTLSLYDDAGTTVDQKATVSDDGTTATKGEIGTGP